MTGKALPHDIEVYLDRFCDRGNQCRDFLELSLGRVLTKESERRSINDDIANHIVDWLEAAIILDEEWISNLDDRGRPRKLMKFGTVAQIAQEADKAMIKAAQKYSRIRLVEGDEELHEQLRDGFYLVRLLTAAALDRESAQMQHCIGNGAYDSSLSDKSVQFLSLRDKGGKPHATIEINDRCIIQCQGKQNRIPLPKYSDLLTDYFSTHKYDSLLPANRTGFVVDADRNWHRIDALPENILIPGDLKLRETSIEHLPRGMTVLGSLSLFDCPIEALPDGLVVADNLDISYTNIKKLPVDLKVGRSIFATRSKLEDLSGRTKVKGVLDLAHTQVKSLPDNLSVYGLDLTGTRIRNLPKGLNVTSHLRLFETPIAALPSDLQVGEYIAIRGTSITEIPRSVCDTALIHSDGLPNMMAREFRELTLMQKFNRWAKRVKSYASKEVSKRMPTVRSL